MNQLSQSAYEMLCNPSPIIKYYFLVNQRDLQVNYSPVSTKPVVIRLPEGTNLTKGSGYHGQ